LLARPLLGLLILGLLSSLAVSAQSIHVGKVQPPPPLGSIVLNGSKGTTTRVGAPCQVVDPAGNPRQRCGSASTEESASVNDAPAGPTASCFAGSWPALTGCVLVWSPASARSRRSAVIGPCVGVAEAVALRNAPGK